MISAVIALVLLGVLLILLEIVFVPGTTIVGVAGVVLLIFGVYMAYSISSVVGNICLVASFVSIVLALAVMLKTKTWERMALHHVITGKVETAEKDVVSIGEHGITLGRLNPVGNATFGDRIIEVHSSGGFVDEGEHVEVVRIVGNRVQVEPIATESIDETSTRPDQTV